MTTTSWNRPSKHDDGAPRARAVTMAALLSRHGVDTAAGVDTEAVRATGRAPLLGGGVPVGEIRATLPDPVASNG